jgi:hypothetical protein
MHKLIAIAALAASLSVPGAVRAASVADGGTAGAWLNGYAGARSLGLGGALVGVGDEALGALWNPAGLQFMDQNQVMFENVQLFEDTSMNGIGFAVPGNWLPTFGLSMVSLRSGEFQRTNEMNDPLGTFQAGETAYLFTLAHGLSRNVAIGANLKVVQQSVEDFSAGGFGADLGALWQITPTLRAGASLLNLGGPAVTLRDTKEAWPAVFRAGLAMHVFSGRGLVTAELDQASGGSGTTVRAGSEYWVQNVMALRVGMDGERATGGVSYRISPQYQVDYGVADHPLGLTHRIGLRYGFGGFFASSKATPELFSPTGEKATTQVSLNAHTKGDADHWTLDFVDKREQVVRRFGGPGLPPPHVEWDGKDEAGMPVADGAYRYRLTVQDKDGRVLTSGSRRVHIATGGPQGDVPVQTEH